MENPDLGVLMPADINKIGVSILCGFLGSGKTTLLRRWRLDKSLRNAAYIVHDLSELGVDVELLADDDSKPEVGQLFDRVAALHGKHSKEGLHKAVGGALSEIAALNPLPPHVLCESTGAARPWPLIKALTQNSQFFLRHFIVTVDALNLHRDFADGQAFLDNKFASRDPALQHAASILAEQLIFANVIILTKVDTLPRSVVDEQVRHLQKILPQATIALSARAGLQLSQLDATQAPNLADLKRRADQFGLSVDSQTANNVEASVLCDPRPFHPQRLYEACQTQLGTGIYRTKGFVWLASRPADVLLWQQSGSQISLELTGVWSAEAVNNSYGKLLPQELEILKKQMETSHPVFGDRHNELTFIGLPEACQTFAKALKNCLCTDREVASWQRGEPFSDPWPRT